MARPGRSVRENSATGPKRYEDYFCIHLDRHLRFLVDRAFLSDRDAGEMKEAIQAVRSRGQMPSQDFDALQAIYRDLQSNDPQVKSQALNALVKREGFLNFVDTPDRLLQLLAQLPPTTK